jgi:hypothetical protein
VVVVADLSVEAAAMLVVAVAASAEPEVSALLDQDSAAALTIIVEACVSLIQAQGNCVLQFVDRPPVRVRSAARTIRLRANYKRPGSDRVSIA